MLLIQTFVRSSPIHGNGLFTAVRIRAGDVIGVVVPIFDPAFTPKELLALPESARPFLATHAYKSRFSGVYRLDGDNGRHMNHAVDPNCVELPSPDGESQSVALRDVAAGDELTEDYRCFEVEDDPDNLLHQWRAMHATWYARTP